MVPVRDHGNLKWRWGEGRPDRRRRACGEGDPSLWTCCMQGILGLRLDCSGTSTVVQNWPESGRLKTAVSVGLGIAHARWWLKPRAWVISPGNTGYRGRAEPWKLSPKETLWEYLERLGPAGAEHEF